MNESDPADTASAQNESRSASRHFSILMVRFGVAIVLVTIAILLVRLALTPGLFGIKPYQVNVKVEGAPVPSVSSQSVTQEEIRQILTDILVKHNAENRGRTDGPPTPVVKVDQDGGEKHDSLAASSARMVFIRIGDAEVGPKGGNGSDDYYVPAGMDNLSGAICGKAIAKGLVAVSRKPGLRAKILMPSDKKIGIIPDWRVWGLLGRGKKVLDVSVPTEGEYVQFDQWAKAKEVRFYWTADAAEGNNDPLVIKVYKE